MNYKQKYLDELRSIKSYKIFFIFILTVEAIFILSDMNLFYGYFSATILFYRLITDNIKRLLITKKEIKSIEETS